MLASAAPVLLKSLYQRDSRRSFCQPQLWVAPYQEMFGTAEEEERRRQALQEQQAHAEDDDGSDSGGDDDNTAAASGRSSTARQQGRSNRAAGANAAASSSSSSVRSRFGEWISRAEGLLTSLPRAASSSAEAGNAAATTRGGESTSSSQGILSMFGGADGADDHAGGGQHSSSSGRRRGAPDIRDAPVGGYGAGVVVQALVVGAGAGGEDDDDADASQQSSGGIGGAPLAAPALQGGRPAGAAAAASGGGGVSHQPAVSRSISHRPSAIASLLRTAPQAVPFKNRVDLFRALLVADKSRGGYDRAPYAGGVPPIQLTIRRASLMDDAYRALGHLGPAVRARLSITFVNEAGLQEAGLDYGGLMKEFLEEVVVRGFHADAGLFAEVPSTGQLYPRPSAHRMDSGLQLLEFMGLMVGKALYEGILLNVAFAPFFITRLQGGTPLLDDLATLDPDLHRSLMQVKQYSGDVSDLGLTFSVEDDFFGHTTQYALLPGQADAPVTNDNRLLYCHLLADWHLNVRLGRAAEAFARGLAQLIPPASLRLFSPLELNQLISGGGEEAGGALDVTDMKRYAQYSGGYSSSSSTVRMFWKVVAGFNAKERGMLLRFVTSCSRAPLGGFRYLQPPLTIHKVDCDASVLAVIGGKDVERLPSASTCYNMLKLPSYRRSDTMRAKLLAAITSGAGFELS